MDKVTPVKFNVIIVQASLVTLCCQQKQSMTEGWTDGQTMDKIILTLVTHNNKNDMILSIWINIVWRSNRSHSSVSACLMSFDHLQMPVTAGLIFRVLEWPLSAVCSLFCFVLSLFHLQICFSLHLFLFCEGPCHFLRVTSYWARYFFLVS